MPGGDRTGPMGLGPMTGRAAGYCAGFGIPGFMNFAPGGVAWNYGGSTIPPLVPAYGQWMPYGTMQPWFPAALGWGRGRGGGRGRGRGFGKGLGRGNRWFGW